MILHIFAYAVNLNAISRACLYLTLVTSSTEKRQCYRDSLYPGCVDIKRLVLVCTDALQSADRLWLVTDAIGTPVASGILLLRTTAVWHQNKRVWIPLVCMLLGQIVLWLQTFRYSRTEWNDQRKSCVILSTAPNPLLVTVFSYSEHLWSRRDFLAHS